MNKPTLVIVESKAKAEKISKFLGKNYIVRASYGHVRDLAVGGRKGIGVDIKNSFKPRYSLIKEKRDKLQSIIDAAEQSKEIFIASDPDREGEAIAWHLAEYLESTGKPVYRVLFNEITKKAVKKAVKKPGSLDPHLYDAQQARRVLDRIVGFIISPYLMNKIGQPVSAGRVQSVAVKLVVNRENEISNFKPKEYWVINNVFKKDDIEFETKCVEVPNSEKEKDNLFTELKDNTYFVSGLKRVKITKSPTPPLITSKLQQLASTKYRFSAKKTMELAQNLYEDGLITYMRTDSVRNSKESIDAVRQYLIDNELKHPEKPNTYSNSDQSQDAHEAIRPTNVKLLPKNLLSSDDEKKIYDLIWRKFVASQMKPAVFDQLNLSIVSSSGVEFKTSGRSLVDKGYMEIWKEKESKADKAILPNLSLNEKIQSKNLFATQKFTQPPPRYNEASLIEELESKKIGRPSTYAPTIEKIKKKYIEIKENSKNSSFIPTDLGKKVVGILDNLFTFLDYKYTANMEEKLDLIANGKIDYVDMLNDFYEPFKEEVYIAYKDLYGTTDFTCPKCQRSMMLRNGRYGHYLACINQIDCKYTVSVKLDEEQNIIVSQDREYG